jgi:hypothetical protein
MGRIHSGSYMQDEANEFAPDGRHVYRGRLVYEILEEALNVIRRSHDSSQS